MIWSLPKRWLLPRQRGREGGGRATRTNTMTRYEWIESKSDLDRWRRFLMINNQWQLNLNHPWIQHANSCESCPKRNRKRNGPASTNKAWSWRRKMVCLQNLHWLVRCGWLKSRSSVSARVIRLFVVHFLDVPQHIFLRYDAQQPSTKFKKSSFQWVHGCCFSSGGGDHANMLKLGNEINQLWLSIALKFISSLEIHLEHNYFSLHVELSRIVALWVHVNFFRHGIIFVFTNLPPTSFGPQQVRTKPKWILIIIINLKQIIPGLFI